MEEGVGYKVAATVMGVKGKCSTGHKIGETFEISCYNSGGLCGFFYHSIFPSLSTFQFGGSYPWWSGDIVELTCPDPQNQVTLRLERKK